MAGTCSAPRDVELARGLRELLSTLGCASRLYRRYLSHEGHPRPPMWEIVARSRAGLARMPRKACSVAGAWHRDHESHYVVDVRAVPSVPVRCVQVSGADHLYLAGRSMIPTHNSTLALDVARNAAVKHHLASVIFSLEMSKTEITMRLLSAEAGIRLGHMRAGTMSEQDWQKIVRRMTEISDAPLVHRRFAQHDDDGDPGQGAAAQAAQRPEAHRRRLPAADDVRQAASSPGSRRSASSPGR